MESNSSSTAMSESLGAAAMACCTPARSAGGLAPADSVDCIGLLKVSLTLCKVKRQENFGDHSIAIQLRSIAVDLWQIAEK
jgi:hypothetical protein